MSYSVPASDSDTSSDVGYDPARSQLTNKPEEYEPRYVPSHTSHQRASPISNFHSSRVNDSPEYEIGPPDRDEYLETNYNPMISPENHDGVENGIEPYSPRESVKMASKYHGCYAIGGSSPSSSKGSRNASKRKSRQPEAYSPKSVSRAVDSDDEVSDRPEPYSPSDIVSVSRQYSPPYEFAEATEVDASHFQANDILLDKENADEYTYHGVERPLERRLTPSESHESPHKSLDIGQIFGDDEEEHEKNVGKNITPSKKESTDILGDYENVERADDFEGFERDEQTDDPTHGIIADIFGESDAEEEFEGFAENEVEKGTDRLAAPTSNYAPISSREEEESEGEAVEFVSDFDSMMQVHREEARRKRRRNKDVEFLNDSDDMILDMIARMKNAAEEDRLLLAAGHPATKKLTMVNSVTDLLKKADLKSALIENGILSAITEWLAPLPGQTLPNLVVRDAMLTHLSEFQHLTPDILRESGIGKAVMYLYKHPRETRANKSKASRLINEWSRPIFNLTSDFRSLSKEERKQLDYEHLPKRRNIDNESLERRDINRELESEKGLLRPGDPGWIGRARVPQPSTKDYVVRPRWRSDEFDDQDGEGEQQVVRRKRSTISAGQKPSSRLQVHIRNLSGRSRAQKAKVPRAVPMSIEGRRMAL